MRRIIKNTSRVMAGAAVAAALCLFLSGGTLFGYKLLGHNLGLGQRDLRIYNNFQDPTANDNQTPDADFPGTLGAVMALWKGAIEWGSERMGQSSWGNGGANFDPVYVGEADKVGTTTSNIMSALDQNGGNVIAYMMGGGNGWKIRYYDQPWVWYDGPDNTPSGGNRMDLQGICAHEYGHALGLDHSSDPNATMYAYVSGSGNSQRTINSDDIAGVKAIYGSLSASKPHISSISGGTTPGSALTITGYNFSVSGNEVWFTGDGSVGEAVKVTNVPSSGGGTTIDVTVPAGAKSGTVLVKSNGSSHSNLSNNFPFGSGGGLPVADIKIDGQDNPSPVPSSQAVTLTVSLDPGGEAGVDYDWWIFGQYNFSSKYWWKYPGSWTGSATPIRAYSGPLFTLNNYTFAQGKLPVGWWDFTFAVDALNNNYEGTYSDTVSIQSY